MFLTRLLILIVIVAVLLWLLKRAFGSNPEPDKLESTKTENMRQCKYCGVHVPESAIVTEGGEPYCCPEHAELDRQ